MRSTPVARAASILLVVLFLGMVGWMFGRALFLGEMFAFRDSAHFYFPLFESIQEQWRAGRLPLWDPLENAGMPLVGNATASVLYPGKLIYWLPIGSLLAFKLYVVGHVLLAGWATHRLARGWGLSPAAAMLSAIVYAFSGAVLYQYCNVIFLVGAAWTPLAVLYGDRLIARGRWSDAARLGAVLAMMVFGGDPQSAYHAGLILGLLACVRRRERNEVNASSSWRRGAFTLTQLAAAALIAGLLAAVQVLPSMEFTRQSERASHGVPRSLWEAPLATSSVDDAGLADAVLCRGTAATTHVGASYDFSVGPWRLAELVWPNVGGRQFPVHTRWLDALPAETRIWVPTLYLGVVPLLLAVAAMRFRRRATDGRATWLTWVAVLSILASFGGFGLVWAIREITTPLGAPFPDASTVGGSVGGLYWMMNIVLPGYAGFRYAAKWWTVASLVLALLAGMGLDRAASTDGDVPRRVRWGAVGLWGLGIVGIVAMCAARPWWNAWMTCVPADALFGPIDAAAAWRVTLLAFVQSVCVLCLLLAWRVNRRRLGEWSGAALVFLVAVDLAAANGWIVATAPDSAWERPVAMADAIDGSGDVPPRVYRRAVWYPSRWANVSCEDRLAESVAWDRASLWPKYNRRDGIAVAEVHGTMSLYDFYVLGACMRGSRSRMRSGVEMLGASHAIVPPSFEMAESRFERVPLQDGPEDVALWRVKEAAPRAWIVPRWSAVMPLGAADFTSVARRTQTVLWPEGRPRDLAAEVVIEADANALPEPTRSLLVGDFQQGDLAPPSPIDEETCRVAAYEPSRVGVEVALASPRVVVLRDQYYPGWTATVTSLDDASEPPRDVPILRANRFMRAVILPAGQHRVTFAYRPWTFITGAWISAIAWAALLVGAGIRLLGRSPGDGPDDHQHGDGEAEQQA